MHVIRRGGITNGTRTPIDRCIMLTRCITSIVSTVVISLSYCARTAGSRAGLDACAGVCRMGKWQRRFGSSNPLATALFKEMNPSSFASTLPYFPTALTGGRHDQEDQVGEMK